MSDLFETATIGTRVIWRTDPTLQGRIVEIREPSGRNGVMVQVDWDNGHDDTDAPWWPFDGFHVPKKKHQQKEATA